jgi:uncharacterized membrane protein YphA (DoxX/SURF4 family)
MKRFAQIGAIISLALIFAGSGLVKLINPAMFEVQFAKFGLPAWFVFATGAVELSGAALIAFFKGALRRFGAAMLAVTMAVATSLHLIHDPLGMALPAFVLLALSGTVALIPLRNNARESLGGT